MNQRIALVMVLSAPILALPAPAQTPTTPATQRHRDELRIAVQDICPVSGKKLGSMGEPVKVQVGEETVFLCCQGCLGQQIKREHWTTIHANVARAQGICPVMENELPKKPKWTVVEGQVVYVCCPPCIEKLAAHPDEYLAKLDSLYTAHLARRAK